MKKTISHPGIILLLSMMLLGCHGYGNWIPYEYTIKKKSFTKDASAIFNNILTKSYSDHLQDSCNCIKDSLTAVQFAKKEFVKVYGAEVLKQEPFVAVLRDSIWYVEGTFPYNTNSLPSSESIPDSIDSNGIEYYFETVAVGGVAYIKIDKKTCKIIEINHGE